MNVDWHMDESLRPLLLGPDGLRLIDWRAAGMVTVVKDSPHRAVYRVRLPELDFHVKQYRPIGLRSRLRELLRPDKARREFELARRLRDRGIATPEPLAWGREALGFGQTAGWLITRTCLGSSLLEFFDNGEFDRIRFAPAVADFVARLHAAGVVHRDLHPGNILVDRATLAFSLLDLHAVQLGRRCSWNERRDNLVIFNRYFMLRTSRSDRLRFWREYAAIAGAVVAVPADQAGREIERRTLQSNRRFWAARDRRSLHSNRYYRRFAQGEFRGIAVRDLNLAALFAENDCWFKGDESRVLKNGRSSAVVELRACVGGRPVSAILKRFHCLDRRQPWLALLRRAPALRSWLMGHGLRERCLPTARPLAVFHRYSAGLPRESYLLCKKIEHALDLRAFADRLLAGPQETQQSELNVRLPALARLIRQLHVRGLSHRDLKAANILTSEVPGDSRFWFIDLVGVRRHRRVGMRRRARNLARLHASFLCHPLITQTDKLRFLRAYLAWGLSGKSGWKNWWREIDVATREKTLRNSRSGRPLY